jgi:hypothetical protein
MYDSDTSTVQTALQTSNPTVFNTQTINDILALTTKTGDAKVTFDTAAPDANGNVTVAAGAEVVLVASSDTVSTIIKPPVNAPVVIFQGKGGVVATFNDGATTVPAGDGKVDRIVVGSAGNDKIVVADHKDTKIVLGTGNSTVTAGGGNDTVVAGLGNSTITGGTGDTVVVLSGNAASYTVTVNNGHAVVTNIANTHTTDISKLQYVALDNGKALVFAANSVEASVATLYHTAFGRDAEAGGLNYWFDVVKGGASLKQVAQYFTSSAEFAPFAAESNTAFVQDLYQHTFGRAGEDSGVAFWLDAIAHGSSRADLIYYFAQIGGQNIAGTVHTEAQVVGSVTIVTGIV